MPHAAREPAAMSTERREGIKRWKAEHPDKVANHQKAYQEKKRQQVTDLTARLEVVERALYHLWQIQGAGHGPHAANAVPCIVCRTHDEVRAALKGTPK